MRLALILILLQGMPVEMRPVRLNQKFVLATGESVLLKGHDVRIDLGIVNEDPQPPVPENYLPPLLLKFTVLKNCKEDCHYEFMLDHKADQPPTAEQAITQWKTFKISIIRYRASPSGVKQIEMRVEK